MKLLLDRGATADARDNCGRAPIHYAVCSGKVQILSVLGQKSAGTGGSTSVKVVQLKDHGGRTALHHVVFAHENPVEMAQKLIEMGAEVNALDID